MYRTSVIIISGRKELAVKYKKMVENLSQEAVWTGNLAEALGLIQTKKFEFIIISDTIKEKLSDFIGKIRVLTYNFRPVIVAVSKSNDVSDKLEILQSGADDVIGEETTKQELQMRFLAHIRRYVESFSNSITGLSDKNITLKAIKQSLDDENKYSYLLIKIKGAFLYRKTHGEIAWEKAIKTLGAIINSTLDKKDFVGHLNDNEMIIITNPLGSEQMASFLTFAFDNILNKFYSSDEFKNNFTIQSSDEDKENKEGLMRLNIASVEKNEGSDVYDILNSLYELTDALKDSKNSTYIIDRAKLQGQTSNYKKNKVLIFEPDSSLSYLIQNVCTMKGIQAKTVLSENEFNKLYKDFAPDVVVLDWSAENKLKAAKKISKDNVKLIFSSSYLNKKEILKSGADIYLPKPYEIDDMINSIKKFLI